MRVRLLFNSLFTIVAIATHAQTNLLQNTQGIRQGNATYYDTEGYRIFIQDFSYPWDDKGINKFRKKMSVPTNAVMSEDTALPNVKILEWVEGQGKSAIHTVYYLSQAPDEKIKLISFQTHCDRDKALEKEFQNLVINNEIPDEVLTPMGIDTIQFAGRPIALGSTCRWMDVRNVQCSGLGQMNWSEFSSEARARQMIEAQKTRTSEKKMGEVIEEQEVDVEFEGIPVKALKRKLKIKVPKMIMGGSNVLFIYYVTVEVRGRFVACVLSHYDDEVGTHPLPPLLREVMELKH